MSILIPDMGMPKNCDDCFAEAFGYCRALKYNPNEPMFRAIDDTMTRREDCPLVELPPHGDLIDKRMLINDISNNTFANADVDSKEEYDFWNRVWEYIRKVPIVVESEE